MNKAIVTGGAGFIGSYIVEELVRKGLSVVVLDNLSLGSTENIEAITNQNNVNIIKGDILDVELLKKSFQDIDIVFHEAAITGVSRSIKNPMLVNDVNIKGTLNVLIAARDNKVKRVVFASSAAVYGDAPLLPVKENIVCNPQSPYALTKLTCEYYCRLFHQLFSLSTICLRYFNVYGPRQDPNSEYSAVIPTFIYSVLKNRPPTIYGDGNQTRDFVFIKDVVHANIVAAGSKATGVFNIGSGHGTSINELARHVTTISGKKLQPVYRASRFGEVRNSIADITLAQRIGYKPNYTLENGLRETIRNMHISD
jgi:nucleoside-diphosphate-sugar epimerase